MYMFATALCVYVFFMYWVCTNKMLCLFTTRLCVYVCVVIYGMSTKHYVYVFVFVDGMQTCKTEKFGNEPLCLYMCCCRGYSHM